MDLDTERFAGMHTGMSQFRREVQAGTPVRPPLPPPAPHQLPPFPGDLAGAWRTHLHTLGDGIDVRELYAAAGAAPALEALHTLTDVHYGGTLFFVLKKACADIGIVRFLPQRSITCTNAAGTDAAAPPSECSEHAALHRLDHILAPSPSPSFMSTYREARFMSSGAAADESALLSRHLSLGTLALRTVWFRTMNALDNDSTNQSHSATPNDISVPPDTTTPESPGPEITSKKQCPVEGSHPGGYRPPLAAHPLGHPRLLPLLCPPLRARPHCRDRPRTPQPSLVLRCRCLPNLGPGPGNRDAIVDANLRELAAAGRMSNRGRQCAANFLAKGLQVHWRWGAALFEALLVDADPCAQLGELGVQRGGGV